MEAVAEVVLLLSDLMAQLLLVEMVEQVQQVQ
jgi:hypothetical protein